MKDQDRVRRPRMHRQRRRGLRVPACPEEAAGSDAVLECLEIWDKGFCHGHEPSPESLVLSDPRLLQCLRHRIDQQKQLYEFLKFTNVLAEERAPRLQGDDAATVARADASAMPVAAENLPAPAAGPDHPAKIGRYRVTARAGPGKLRPCVPGT